MTTPIDADAIGKNDAAYWAARLMIAIRKGNEANAERARLELRRLGYEIVRASEFERRRALR